MPEAETDSLPHSFSSGRIVKHGVHKYTVGDAATASNLASVQKQKQPRESKLDLDNTGCIHKEGKVLSLTGRRKKCWFEPPEVSERGKIHPSGSIFSERSVLH